MPARQAEAASAGDQALDEPHIVLDESAESTANATGAAMLHVLGRPDSIRQRALNAATISSGVIAALAIASAAQILSDGTEAWGTATETLALAALAAWVVSVGAYVWVVAGRRPKTPDDPTYQDVVNTYEEYAASLRRRLRWAAVASLLALVVTVAALS